MFSVALLAVQDCMSSSLTGLCDILTVASLEWQKTCSGKRSEPLFAPTVIGPPNRSITAFNGTPIKPETDFSNDVRYDLVFVPVIFGDLERLLQDAATIEWLRTQGETGSCLCSVCAGSFFLAATGRLDGKKATTHWNLADRFAAMFPEVLLKREKMLIDEGDCITAGGVSAYLDLSLYLVARFGSGDLAASLSKLMLIDPSRRLQSPYKSKQFAMGHGDHAILAVQQWLAANFARQLTIREMAALAKLGDRTIMRRFKKATGDTPLEYLQQLRIAEARKLLETTTESVDDIILQTGYEDASSFRKLFKRGTGLSLSAYRKRFTLFL